MRRTALPACLLVPLAALTGCGATPHADRDEARGAAASVGEGTPRLRFPSADGGSRSLADVRAGLPGGLRASPRTSRLRVGRDRVSFTLRDRAGTPLQLARVAVYVAGADGSHVRGPFPARSRAVDVVPPGGQEGDRLTQTSTAYRAEVPVRRRGRVVVAALVAVDGRLMAASPFVLAAG